VWERKPRGGEDESRACAWKNRTTKLGAGSCGGRELLVLAVVWLRRPGSEHAEAEPANANASGFVFVVTFNAVPRRLADSARLLHVAARPSRPAALIVENIGKVMFLYMTRMKIGTNDSTSKDTSHTRWGE
jgi:hypothetical protein